MAVPTTAKKLAVDSNILFDLASEDDFAHTFREVLQERNYSISVPPTVVQELTYAAFHKTAKSADEKTQRRLAEKALREMLAWKITPFNLIPTGHAITEQFVKKLQLCVLLPDEESNDRLILAEISLADIPLLITNDLHLTQIDATQLHNSFEASDLSPVIVVRPRILLRALAQ